MRDLWRRRGRLLLSLGLLIVCYSRYACGASVGELSMSLRSLSPSTKDAEVESAPPVFCLDVGVEIAFPSRDVEDAMGSVRDASAGKGCLRSSPMNAVVGHLKASLRTFSLHAVDCVLEPMDVESSTIALLGIASLCSRSNMEVEEDMESWGRDAKRQVDKLFETEKRVSFKQTTGMVRHVAISPAYELPASGSGLPQFILGETLIWSDAEEDGAPKETKGETFFTHVQLHVKNDGKTPLHLYQLTLAQTSEKQDKSAKFVLPLVAPAVVQPGKSEVVSFKAITSSAVDSSKSYLLYISHSGFRSHVFEGILDGKTFLSREEAVQPQGEDGLFDRFSFDSTNGQSFYPGFPYASWQVGSMAIAVAVGLAVMLYIRRNKRSAQSGNRTSAKPISNRIASSRAALSKKGEDHIEMESLIKKPTAAKTPNTGSVSSMQLPTPPRSKMPAITMKWKAPPLPPPRVHSTSEKTSLAVPKALEVTKEMLDLDRKARLHPKRFESMWDEYVERFHSEVPNSTRPDSDTLLKKMEARGISCMASGTVAGVEKFVFYAKQRDRSWFFLATVDVTVATATTVLTVRASSDATEELVVQFVDVVKTTLAQSALS